jgi:LacI family transcriptional regulator
MATIKEVAKRARVSVGTVSNVLSGVVPVSPELRTRVLNAIKKLQYEPNQVARSLKIRQTKMIGMLVPDITNPFFPQVIRGAEDAALVNGYLLVTFNTDDRVDREQQVLSVLRGRRVDGILLVIAPNETDASHITNALAAGIPIIALDRLPDNIALDSVTVDNRQSARACVRHLIEAGHRKIGIIHGSTTLQTGRDRLQGYRQAMKEAGIAVDAAHVKGGNFRVEAGYRLCLELLSSENRPTAIFVTNGMMTIGALKAMEELGVRCPGEVALASFDDFLGADAFRPHLTTVAQPAYEIGKRGAELLIGRIEGKITDKAPVAIRLSAELRVRDSSRGPASRKMAKGTTN